MWEEMKSCHLCPRNCGVDRTKEKGFCQAGNTMKIGCYRLHPWEEPCISGQYGSGTIFFTYCNLQCIFCQNRQISHDHIGYDISVERFAEICLELQEKKATNINLVTPTHFLPQIKDGLTLAKKQGLTIPIVYNTSGYEKKETIQKLDGIIDIYLPDFKYWSEELAKELSQAKNYRHYAIESLEEMVRQTGKPTFDKKGNLLKGVIVRHLVLPEHQEDSKKILSYLYNTYHDKIILSIMNQYTPLCQLTNHQELNRTLSSQEYDEVINYALDIGITKAFMQEGETQKESFIPEFSNSDKKKKSSI